jgi:hypothetical protein
MTTEKDFLKAISEAKASPVKVSLAELTAKIWEGKIVEIYVGDTYEDIKYEDSTAKYPAVVVGKIIGAYGECMFINCAYMDQRTKQMQIGNMICLNERSVRFITEVDESGVLKDCFLSTRDNRVVKDLFSGKK